jgi:hypothetical protein
VHDAPEVDPLGEQLKTSTAAAAKALWFEGVTPPATRATRRPNLAALSGSRWSGSDAGQQVQVPQ